MNPQAFQALEFVPPAWQHKTKNVISLDDELVTISGAAELCKVDPAFIRKAIWGRGLRVIILGPKTRRILLSELHRWRKCNQKKGLMVPRESRC
jgi:hypothetical protein